jgi:hypothetical protein
MLPHSKMALDDLHHVKDDMTAFIEGHGMRRFLGYVSDDVSSVMWENNGNTEGWKDFVELAKAAGASFLTMNDVVLEREDIDFLIERLRTGNYTDDDDIEEARWLRAYVGKTGFVQIGFPYQGTIFLYEVSTEWYDRYQRLVDAAEEFGGIVIDETDQDDEH